MLFSFGAGMRCTRSGAFASGRQRCMSAAAAGRSRAGGPVVPGVKGCGGAAQSVKGGCQGPGCGAWPWGCGHGGATRRGRVTRQGGAGPRQPSGQPAAITHSTSHANPCAAAFCTLFCTLILNRTYTHGHAESSAPLCRFLRSTAGSSGGEAGWLGTAGEMGAMPALPARAAAAAAGTAVMGSGARHSRLVSAGWLHIIEMAVATLTCRQGGRMGGEHGGRLGAGAKTGIGMNGQPSSLYAGAARLGPCYMATCRC